MEAQKNNESVLGTILGIVFGLGVNLLVIMRWYSGILGDIPQISEFCSGPKGDIFVPLGFLLLFIAEFLLARHMSRGLDRSGKTLLAGVAAGVGWSVIFPGAMLCITLFVGVFSCSLKML
jgi:hypothetical protein